MTFKTKIFEAFECNEDGHSLIWIELFRFFPEDPSSMQLFPYTKFFCIWDNLTWTQ